MREGLTVIVSVKVGEKGQIIIPVEARKMFDIKAKDTLMFLGDKKRGMAIMKADDFYQLALDKADEIYKQTENKDNASDKD